MTWLGDASTVVGLVGGLVGLAGGGVSLTAAWTKRKLPPEPGLTAQLAAAVTLLNFLESTSDNLTAATLASDSRFHRVKDLEHWRYRLRDKQLRELVMQTWASLVTVYGVLVSQEQVDEHESMGLNLIDWRATAKKGHEQAEAALARLGKLERRAL